MAQPMSDQKLNPEAERTIAKARRLMLIANITTLLAIGVVLSVIGYRVFSLGESAPAEFVDVTAQLPAGAKVQSTAVSSDHIIVTVQTMSGVELLTFDPDTLKPLGRLRLAPKL
jgi:hypothetical protein